MSKLLELTAEVSINDNTGKRRILTHIYRDETLDLAFIIDAQQAEQWAAKLIYLANECRKKEPTQNRETIKFFEPLWSTLKKFIGK